MALKLNLQAPTRSLPQSPNPSSRTRTHTRAHTRVCLQSVPSIQCSLSVLAEETAKKNKEAIANEIKYNRDMDGDGNIGSAPGDEDTPGRISEVDDSYYKKLDKLPPHIEYLDR